MLSRRFGVFAPVGYLILAFREQADAAQARDALLTGGYEADEILWFNSDEVIADIENNRGNVSPLAHFGTELGFQERQLDYAKHGYTFLVVYAPVEGETARVLKVARRYGAQLAHKYNRLTIEDIPMGTDVARRAS